MTSYKGLGPQKQFLSIRSKPSKPFRRELTHYAEKLLHEFLSNIYRKKGPSPIGCTKVRHFSSCFINLAQYSLFLKVATNVPGGKVLVSISKFCSQRGCLSLL